VKSTGENLLFWEQRIRERVQNGMTIGEWCENNGVSKYKYNYWNQKVRTMGKTSEEKTFADVTSILSSGDTAKQNTELNNEFQIFFKSFQVSVPYNFNPSSLTGLMKVLQEL
jgi:hypothetical protein